MRKRPAAGPCSTIGNWKKSPAAWRRFPRQPFTRGRVAQLVRAPASHAGGPRFESVRAHHLNQHFTDGRLELLLYEHVFPKDFSRFQTETVLITVQKRQYQPPGGPERRRATTQSTLGPQQHSRADRGERNGVRRNCTRPVVLALRRPCMGGVINLIIGSVEKRQLEVFGIARSPATRCATTG
jgi:hypothetical protein